MKEKNLKSQIKIKPIPTLRKWLGNKQQSL